ncbi:MAG: PEGA domain-containing protein [Myxococcales bacterium]|nr:PEGA domain-containing protein [Myxococcales bacterium]
MKSALRVWLLVSMLCLPQLAPRAMAATPEVRRLVVKMERSFNRKAYREAAKIAEELYAKTKKARFLANAALCYDLLIDDERALELYRRYLKADPAAKNKNTIVERIQFLRNRHALKKREVTFLSDPSGSSVVLTQGGKKVFSATTPSTSWLPFGTFRVRFSRAGHVPVERVLVISQGPPLTVDQTLLSSGAKGMLSVKTTPPRATIIVDGRPVGKSPLENKPLVPGTILLRIELPGYETIERSVTIIAGKPSELSFALLRKVARVAKTPTRRYRSKSGLIGAWSMFGGGAAVAIAGGVLHLLARKTINDANSSLDATPFANRDQAFIDQILAKERDAKTLNKVGLVLIGVGSAALIGSAIWLIIEYRRPRRERLSARMPMIEPLILDRGAAIQVRLQLP